MPEQPQTYATHRRYFPLFHFFALPVLAINVLVGIYVIIRRPSGFTVWNLLVALALVALAFAARQFGTANQDRIIRLEETLRLSRCLPDDLRSRIGELTIDQLIGLRFCSDEELPDLMRAVLAGELKRRNDIKQRIKNWRPDYQRV